VGDSVSFKMVFAKACNAGVRYGSADYVLFLNPDMRLESDSLAAPLAVVTMVLVKRLYVIETLDTATPIPGEAKG